MAPGDELEGARLATAEDLPAIGRIAEVIVEHAASQRGGELLLRRESAVVGSTAHWEQAIAADDQWLIAGTFQGVVFGYGLARREVLSDGGALGRLDEFAVDPDARAVGIGESMMNLVIEELTAAGCFGVDSMALPGDRETKNFFESFGLKARLLVVHRRLD